MKKHNQNGFGLVSALLIVVMVAIIVFAGWYVWNANKSVNKVDQSASLSVPTPTPTPTITGTNEGYLVVKEWGLRFKIPSGLTDVRYIIHDNIAGFFARPTGSSVQYRADYDKFISGRFQYAIGVLYRSTSSTEQASAENGTREGKKIGDYYFYTDGAFSQLASGWGCSWLYGDGSNCETGSPEGVAFELVNYGDTALLNTIELDQ